MYFWNKLALTWGEGVKHQSQDIACLFLMGQVLTFFHEFTFPTFGYVVEKVFLENVAKLLFSAFFEVSYMCLAQKMKILENLNKYFFAWILAIWQEA